MSFEEKLIQLRKKNGWSQENLAEEMNVSRQAVSKWESGKSVPELDKMLLLSELFGVSMDYLVKYDMEAEKQLEHIEDKNIHRRVSMEEAKEFLNVKTTAGKVISFAVFLCVVSPIVLIILSELSKIPKYGLSEGLATGIGMVIMLIIVAVAVSIFILNGNKTEPYDFIEKEIFETEYGVTNMIKEDKESYKEPYTKNNIIGVIICILSSIPIFLGGAISEDEFFLTIMFCITLVVAGFGSGFLIRSSIQWESYEMLLQEGEYSRKNKEYVSNFFDNISSAYWFIAISIYLGVSLTLHNWGRSWIILAVAGTLYPAFSSIINIFAKRKGV